MSKEYEFRDAVHGFIRVSEWERDIINSAPFQRLRRIRQLAWTDMVYPGAMHTRFEHSLGVMHVASRLFDQITSKFQSKLEEYGYKPSSLDRTRDLIRVAALLHDLGHAPFSHAAEEVFPLRGDTHRFEHEDYSAAILEHCMRDVIETHKHNTHRITVNEIKEFFSPSGRTRGEVVLWKTLVSGQMDADRMDYLARDAYHCGVTYGRFDLDRLVQTVALCALPENDDLSVGVELGGLHALEGLLLARYMMFTQVYFHRTRVVYDFHYVQALQCILKAQGGVFPSPDTKEGVEAYLSWDDWRVLGELSQGGGGEHAEVLRRRSHYRFVHETPETPSAQDLRRLDAIRSEFDRRQIHYVSRSASKSWYSFNKEAIWLVDEVSGESKPLAELSKLVKEGLHPVKSERLYVAPLQRAAAKEAIKTAG